MKLALGTVQFGIPYGVTNTSGQVAPAEVRDILALAERNRMGVLDTASQYGESERVLGDCVPSAWNVRIVTKTPSFKCDRIEAVHALQLEETLRQSLAKLKRTSVYGLMIHHAADLLSSGGSLLLDAMRRLKDKNLIEKIGVSVYSAHEIDAIFGQFTDIELVQLPFSLVDQRLSASGHLKLLKNRGVEIHARTIFLQGLLLAEPEAVPARLAGLRPLVEDLKQYAAARGLSPAGAALGFVEGTAEIDQAVIGVCSVKELDSIFKLRKPLPSDFDAVRFACGREELINPALWARG